MNYISEAADALHVASNATNDATAARYTARAQALATLAQAEQLRIANLISILNGAREQAENGSAPLANYTRLHADLNPQVMEGLGL